MKLKCQLGAGLMATFRKGIPSPVQETIHLSVSRVVRSGWKLTMSQEFPE